MKAQGHGEKTVHMLTIALAIIAAAAFAIFPQFLTLQTATISILLVLALKTIANVIIDAHNTVNYRKKQ